MSAQIQGDFSKIEIEVVSGNFEWPNLISYIPPGTIVGAPDAIAMVPDGFLVPGKGTGGLYVLLRKDNQNGGFSFSKGSSLVEKEDGWFYHMVNWRDVNLDGRMDIVTARYFFFNYLIIGKIFKNFFLIFELCDRAKAPLGGDFQGELIWLEQPATNPLGGNWKKETLAQGPDVLTVIGDFNTTDDLFELYAAEFFSNLLTVFEISEGDTVAVRQTSIIEKMEAPYDIHLVDLNLDGELNLLVSNHLGGAGGNVTAYTIPSIYMNGSAYQKHPLANGFIVTEPGANQMAPGFLTPYNINNFNIGKVLSVLANKLFLNTIFS